MRAKYQSWRPIRLALLTIGEGLVSQIPALLISTATGIIVTRASSDGDLGSDVAKQLFSNSKTMFVVSGILFGFGIIPGLPKIPFFALAGMTAFAQEKKKEVEPLKIKVGDVAPDFTLLQYDGNGVKPVSLHEFKGKKNVALAFFVFAFTGG